MSDPSGSMGKVEGEKNAWRIDILDLKLFDHSASDLADRGVLAMLWYHQSSGVPFYEFPKISIFCKFTLSKSQVSPEFTLSNYQVSPEFTLSKSQVSPKFPLSQSHFFQKSSCI